MHVKAVLFANLPYFLNRLHTYLHVTFCRVGSWWGWQKRALFTLRVTDLVSPFMDKERKPSLSWDVKHFSSTGCWDVTLEALCIVFVWCVPVHLHQGIWDDEKLLAFFGLVAVPHLIAPGHTQSPLTARGTLHGNATDYPGADYPCCIIIIIKQILSLILKDDFPFRMKVLRFLFYICFLRSQS